MGHQRLKSKSVDPLNNCQAIKVEVMEELQHELKEHYSHLIELSASCVFTGALGAPWAKRGHIRGTTISSLALLRVYRLVGRSPCSCLHPLQIYWWDV